MADYLDMEDPAAVSSGGSEEAVRVFVRIRPLNKRELAEKQTIGWNFNETSMLQDTQNGQRMYAFDRCFSPSHMNQEVYETVGKPVVLKALEGFNGTVFTYGQTGSGKTFTMRGSDSDPGMMVLCIRDIFDYIASHPKRVFELKVSYLEVYNEEINDLLNTGPNSKNLRIVSEDAVRGAVIGGLTEEVVSNPPELLEVLHRGESHRAYGSTDMNAESSRSHTIYRLVMHSRDADDDPEEFDNLGQNSSAPAGRLSFLNLVDLAGSERQKATGATGKTLKEGSNINKSLLSLGAVISKLGELSKKPVKGAKPVFIPYRDSKLTRILKQSLGGNTLTSILCTVTPAPMHIDETVSTLKFGQLCKTIKNNVKNNEVVDDRALLKMYKNMVADLRQQLQTSGRSRVDSNYGLGLEDGDGSIDGGDETSIKIRAELAKMRKENADLRSSVNSLQGTVKEASELEALKNSLDEYQRESQTAVDEERSKLEQEKEYLLIERTKILTEKTHLDEKEGRLGSLLAMLDEKESRLRQHMTALDEQRLQWQQSVADLSKREALVDSWNTSHAERERALDETNATLLKRKEEMQRREAATAELERRLATKEADLDERSRVIDIARQRVIEAEVAAAATSEKLASDSHALSAREAVLDAREKEYVSKRKELDNWNEILAGRDREMARDRKLLDDKLDAANAAEEKQRIKDAELEQMEQEMQMKDIELTGLIEKYKHMLADMDQREALNSEQAARLRRLASELSEKETQLTALQDQLEEKEVRLRGVEAREEELNKRVASHTAIEEDFYNVKVASISSRHAKELAEMEAIIAEQLKVVSNFQSEIERVRTELSETQQEKEALEAMNNARASLIEKLQLEVSLLDTDRKQLLLVEQDIEKLTKLGGTAAEYLKPREGESEPRRGGPMSANPEALTSHILMTQLGSTQRLLTKIIDGQNAKKLSAKPPSPFERPLNIKWYEVSKPKEEKRKEKEHSRHKSSKSKKSESRRSHSPAHHDDSSHNVSDSNVDPDIHVEGGDSAVQASPLKEGLDAVSNANAGEATNSDSVKGAEQNTSDVPPPPPAAHDSDHDDNFIESKIAHRRAPTPLLQDISARRAPSPPGRDSSSFITSSPPPPEYHTAVQPPPDYHRVVEATIPAPAPIAPIVYIPETPTTPYLSQMSSSGPLYHQDSRQTNTSSSLFDTGRQTEPTRPMVDFMPPSGPRTTQFAEEPPLPRGSYSLAGSRSAGRPGIGIGRDRNAAPAPAPAPAPSANQRNIRPSTDSTGSYSAQYSSPTASSVSRRIDNSRQTTRPILSRPIPPPLPHTMSSTAAGSPESPPSRLHLVKNNSAGVPVASINLGLGFKKKLT